MKFSLEVFEYDGNSFFWVVDTIEEAIKELNFYYSKEEIEKNVTKIEIHPLTEKE